jgi:hypothetical protein
MAAGLDVFGLVLLEWTSGQFGHGGMHFLPPRDSNKTD